MLDLPYVYNGSQHTALEPVKSRKRTKVGAMAKMSAENTLQIDLPGSYNGSVTTTTTTTTVTLTAPNGDVTQYTNGTVMTTMMTPPEDLPAPQAKEGEGAQAQSTRFVTGSEDEETDESTATDGLENVVHRLSVSDSSSVSTESSFMSAPSDGASPLRRLATVADVPIMECTDRPTKESLEASDPVSAVVEEEKSPRRQWFVPQKSSEVLPIISVEENTSEVPQITTVEEKVVAEEEEDDENGKEEAHRVSETTHMAKSTTSAPPRQSNTLNSNRSYPLLSDRWQCSERPRVMLSCSLVVVMTRLQLIFGPATRTPILSQNMLRKVSVTGVYQLMRLIRILIRLDTVCHSLTQVPWPGVQCPMHGYSVCRKSANRRMRSS